MGDMMIQESEIDDQLKKEMQCLSLLQESLDRSDQMTENMVGVLSSFEDRLKKLEETITPVYNETKTLQCRHENIQQTLSALDNVIELHYAAEQVEPIIREGPSAGLQNYLEALEKLNKSVQYFTSNNPGSTHMSSATALFESGKATLEREFRNVLSRYSKPVPPIALLDVLATDDELGGDNEPVYIEHFSQRVRTELTTMCFWLQRIDTTGAYLQVYVSVRSAALVKSLQGLKDHFKSRSQDSATMSGMHSPGHNNKKNKDTPSKRMAKRTDLKRTPKKLDASGLKYPAAEDNSSYIDIDFYITAVSALLKLMQSEKILMSDFVMEKYQHKAFENIVAAALDMIVKEGEHIGVSIRRATIRHDQHAILMIFPVLRHLRLIRPDFDLTLEGCTTPSRTKLPSLITSLYGTGSKALNEFVDNVKNDSDRSSNTPRDGTVHELTSNTLIFLEQMLEFDDTVGEMLMTQDPSALPSSDKPKVKVAEFVTKVLSSLGLNLSNKSESYSGALGAIFMLNNYHHVLKSLKRSGLLELIHKYWNADVESYYENQVRESKREYSTSWSKVLLNIMENQTTPGKLQHSSDTHKLKEKDRQLIKDRFAGFNHELEEIHRMQKGYAIPDPELRESMKSDNSNFILEQYRKFWNQYANVNFAKNRAKYVKYTVADVSQILDGFFDTSH